MTDGLALTLQTFCRVVLPAAREGIVEANVAAYLHPVALSRPVIAMLT